MLLYRSPGLKRWKWKISSAALPNPCMFDISGRFEIKASILRLCSRFRIGLAGGTAATKCSQINFSQEIIMKHTGFWTCNVLNSVTTSSVYLWFISPSIDGLLRRSTHAWKYCNHPNHPLGTGFGVLVHNRRIHSHSFSYRGHRDYSACHSRPTYLAALNCAYATHYGQSDPAQHKAAWKPAFHNVMAVSRLAVNFNYYIETMEMQLWA
jgi:hypothetical protein